MVKFTEEILNGKLHFLCSSLTKTCCFCQKFFSKNSYMTKIFTLSVPLTISHHLYFIRTFEGLSMLHHRSVTLDHSKEYYFIFNYTFLALFVAFHQKNCVFIFFISFLKKYRISTTEYWAIENLNRWLDIVSATVY